MKQTLQNDDIGIEANFAVDASSARLPSQAITRLHEILTVIERVSYLEQRASDGKERTDLFHAANNALLIMMNLELLTRHFRLTDECQHPEIEEVDRITEQ